MKINETIIRDIIKDNKTDKSNLLAILSAIQDKYNWLPPQALKIVAKKLEIPLIDVYGVASFYHAFSLTPRGKHVVTVCQGTACHVRGAPFILDRIKNELDINPGCTTKDDQFTLETVNCLGACALAPIVVVDGSYHGQATVQKADAILRRYAKKKSKPRTKTKKRTKKTTRAKRAKKKKKPAVKKKTSKQKKTVKNIKKRSPVRKQRTTKKKSTRKRTTRRSRKK